MKKSAATISEVREILEKAGVSQVRAAQIINIHPQSLNRILLGTANPSVEVLDALVDLAQKLKRTVLVAG